MKRTLPLVAASIALLAAATVHAQRRDRDRDRDDRRDGPSIQVTSWEPKRGPVGTSVEIIGSGITRRTQLIFGGKPLKPRRVERDKMIFVIPRDYGDGTIVLRDPGGYGAGDYTVGTYDVMRPPVIRRFGSARGGYGTKLEIYGDFEQNDGVYINGKQLSVSSYGNDRLIVEIPDWATSDYIVIRRNGYDEVRSPAKFVVLDPAPVIKRFSPEYGPPGTTVRIEGRWFNDRDRVFFGRFPVRSVSRGKDWVEVRVPDRAKNNQYFTIKGAYGEAQTAQEFRLEYPAPTLAEWGPHEGDYGTRVTFRGDNFDDSCDVYYGNRKLRIARRGDHSIEVLVPDDAEDDYFVIRSRYGEVKTGKPFQVAANPRLAGFSPRNGRPGTRIRLLGRNFNKRMRVLVGTWPANVVEFKRDEVWIEIPPEATEGSYDIWVEDGSYRDNDNNKLVVDGYCSFDGWDRGRAHRGETIEIRGNGYHKGVRAYFGDKELAVKRFTRNKIWVTLPDDAHGSDWLYLDDDGHRARSPSKFEIEPNVRVIDKRKKDY